MFIHQLIYPILFLGLAAFHQVSAQDGTCNGEICLEDVATCQNGTCVCDEGEDAGDGTLVCYNDNEFGAHVINDPLVRDFNGDETRLPVPCRYLFTHVVTKLKDRGGNVVGFCEMIVYIWHAKIKGKIYVAGYDMALRVSYDGGPELLASIRTEGIAWNGTYFYDTNATWGEFNPNGPWNGDTIHYDDKPNTGLQIILEVVDDMQQLVVKKCGWRHVFTAYDKVLRRDQPKTPGFGCGLNCAFHPFFKSNDIVMALPPVDSHGGFTIDDIPGPGLKNYQKFMDRALRSGVTQNQPNAGTECGEAKISLDNCDDDERVDAYKACDWILQSPRFIRCFNVGPTCDDIMGLFNDCVDIFCNNGNCVDFQGQLPGANNCTNVGGYPKLDAWVAADPCPPIFPDH